MTAQSFRRQIWITLTGLTLLIMLTIILAWWIDPTGKNGGSYLTAVIPLYIVFSAAWLSSLFQRRIAYTNALRSFWDRLVEAVQQAIQYTYLQTPGEDDFSLVMHKLSCRIDEIRSIFRNVGEIYRRPTEEMKLFVDGVRSGHNIRDYAILIENYGNAVKQTSGVYPYESLKQIQTAISRLGYGDRFNSSDAKVVREIISRLWGILRAELLKELERDYPEFPDTPYR